MDVIKAPGRVSRSKFSPVLGAVTLMRKFLARPSSNRVPGFYARRLRHAEFGAGLSSWTGKIEEEMISAHAGQDGGLVLQARLGSQRIDQLEARCRTERHAHRHAYSAPHDGRWNALGTFNVERKTDWRPIGCRRRGAARA